MQLIYNINMSSKQGEEAIAYILQSQISDVLVKGFAEAYRQKPTFPIQFLANWLKQYSKGKKTQAQLEKTRSEKEKRIDEFEAQLNNKHMNKCASKASDEEKLKQFETSFIQKVEGTHHLVDLIEDFFPSFLEQRCAMIKRPISGSYIGELTFRRKKLEEHSFQPNAEFDFESPKVIQYAGASKTHKFMIGQLLPQESGRSHQVFKEESAEEQEEGKIQKPKYLYVPQVQRDEKINFFKFPRLGAFACFPLKVKSCLTAEAFDKGIGDYKAYVKAKEQIEKQYHDKLHEAKSVYEQARRKFEQHEGQEDDPAFVAEHSSLQQQFKKQESSLKEVEGNPPVIEQFKYETKNKDYIVAVDTLGLDSPLSEELLKYIQNRVDYFREKWQYKEYKMLLEDILQFNEEENGLEALQNYFKDQQRAIVGVYESQIKQQFVNKQKQAQFELTVIKCGKLVKILQEPSFVNSMNAYLHYHIPKFKQIIQIVLMLLGHPKSSMNLPRSNTLDHRKSINKQSIQKMLVQLQKYQLRREGSQLVEGQYKINKLLERLEKVDADGVAKYNSWLFALLVVAKQLCWARIQCRDAKIEAYEARLKAKNDRDNQIAKYQEDLVKSLEAAKAELNEETLPNFNEEDWRKTYVADNPRPDAIFMHELQQYLDIE